MRESWFELNAGTCDATLLMPRTMRQTIAKYLLLLAVLLMPFGMTPASAITDESPARAMMHCADQHDAHGGQSGVGHCTMACAAALPASIAGPTDVLGMAQSPLVSASIAILDGVLPDMSTPPPR
jgi:hypothetical protein